MCGFLTCLHFAVINSLYSNVVLKPKQVICLEKLFLGVDVLAVLPTGYGKSLIYHLLLLMLFARKMLEVNLTSDPLTLPPVCLSDMTSVLLVILPLNSLISDQVQKLSATGLRVSCCILSPAQMSVGSLRMNIGSGTIKCLY